jgi:MFS family permease
LAENQTAKKAILILTAGVLFNLSIGALYAWSVFKTRLTASEGLGGWGWTSAEAGLPYTLAIVFFAIGLLVGGRIQDKTGPRWVVTAGGALVSLGLILSGIAGDNAAGITVCFGIITGIGIGFGYGCITPTALKWFHPSKKGLISGLIVGGFGIAPVYFAPLTNVLLNNFGIEKTFIYMGAGIMLISIPIAQLIRIPPAGYVPAVPKNVKQSISKSTPPVDFTWKEMVKTKRFYLLFIMFLASSSVGLMIIGNMSKIANTQIGITDTAFLALIVSFLAITNTFGRVLGGMMSDKIGRVNALFVVFALQALNMTGFVFYQNVAALLLGIVAAGFCFGTLMSVFPAMTADQWGIKNYGMNYGIMYLAWGLSGVAAPVMADFIYDTSGSFTAAYIIAAVMLVLMIFINFLLKKDIRQR